ncbi:MAG: 16S rRNA (cytidine(1402)-2'-O)-methyltransferase [Clostridiales bacterium]|nr:16S rRNA (cytidine(1402)-2'-O)-methyltransferase [Clostridiales bacterium]
MDLSFTDEQPREKNRVEPSTLYLVGTPIGNLADLSPRALKILSEVDFIAAEDTRVAARLLSQFGIKKTMMPYHEHNMRTSTETVVSRLKDGMSCAVVTDAGMPGISDPGSELAAACAAAGLNVTAVPGPSAALTALVLSGLDTARFSFEGFLSDEGRDSKQRKRLEEISSDRRTLIFYEAPHRLTDTLEMMLEVLGDRRIAVCRELTKLNEEIRRGSLSQTLEWYSENEPRGEFVLVVEGKKDGGEFWRGMTPREHAEYYMNEAGMSKNDAMKAAARDRGVSKSEIYKAFIDNSGED